MGRPVGKDVEVNGKRGSVGSGAGLSQRQKPGLRIRSSSLINTENTGARNKENGILTLKKKVTGVCEAGAEMDQEKDVTPATASHKSQPLKSESKATTEDVEHYKNLAEERKHTLTETLRQKEQLIGEIEQGKAEVMQMKTDMDKLKTQNDQLTEQKNALLEENEILTAENEQLIRLLEAAAERGFCLI